MTSVSIGGRELRLTNLDKALYPDGFTKAQVIDYYVRIAPVMLPHLVGRATSLRRYPDGSDKESFFNKNVPAGSPAWVNRVQIKDNTYPVLDELAALAWSANLAALELHVPLQRVLPAPAGGPAPAWGRPDWPVGTPDAIVFDLDPGPGTGVVECAQVALLIAEVVAPLGMAIVAKTSGSKGMQLYARPPAPLSYEGGPGDGAMGTTGLAKAIAEGLERTHPDRVVSKMTKSLRDGKVFIDWSQNVAAKTTVCVYSLRAREAPTVSTPVTWDEVEQCAAGTAMRFTAPEVLDRVATLGDQFQFSA